MLDLKVIRAEPGRVTANLARRGADGVVDELLAADARARELRTAVEATRAERARISKGIGEAKRAGRDSSAPEAEARRLGEELARDEDALREIEAVRDGLLLGIPNLGEDAAPDGGEDDAIEIRRVGEPPAFAFAPRDHVGLATAAGALNLEAAARVSGARFAYLRGPLVRLQFALISLALDHLEAEGFLPVVPPVMVREEAMYGTGFFPTDRASIYATADDDLYLVGTADVPLAALHRDAIVADADLPPPYWRVATRVRRAAVSRRTPRAQRLSDARFSSGPRAATATAAAPTPRAMPAVRRAAPARRAASRL